VGARVYTIQAKRTVGPKGIVFRSQLEARFADWLCLRALDEFGFWNPLSDSECFYEWTTYAVGRVRSAYTPDFEIHFNSNRFGSTRRFFLEIKPTRPNGDERALMGNLVFELLSPGAIVWPHGGGTGWLAMLFMPPRLETVHPRMAFASAIGLLNNGGVRIFEMKDARSYGTPRANGAEG